MSDSDDVVERVEQLAKALQRIADMPPDAQPHYPNGIRPFSTNEIKYLAETAELARAALSATLLAQIGTRCTRCGTSAPEAFAAKCAWPECEYRARAALTGEAP